MSFLLKKIPEHSLPPPKKEKPIISLPKAPNSSIKRKMPSPSKYLPNSDQARTAMFLLTGKSSRNTLKEIFDRLPQIGMELQERLIVNKQSEEKT